MNTLFETGQDGGTATTHDWLNRCHFGDCLETLRRMPDAFVHCGISSPPYYGLRDYSVPPTDWPAMEYRTLGGVLQVPAMSCCLGLEPTPEAFIGHIVLIYREVRRVLRDDGVCWVNMGDSYTSGGRTHERDPDGKNRAVGLGARRIDTPEYLKPKDLIGIPWMMAFALRYDGWYLRQGVIWSKPNPMPESVTDRCTKAHEDIFLLSKSPRYYFDNDAIREPWEGEAAKAVAMGSKEVGQRGINASARRGLADNQTTQFKKQGHSGYFGADGKCLLNPLGANKRSVWKVATRAYKGAHFATYPEELVEPMVLAGCPPGGIVLDQFFGSGTTGAVAQRLGRQFIGIELNDAYKPLQDERLRQPSLILEAA
mgnify:FL=1